VDKEELDNEKKYSEEFFRLTMDGDFKDFDTLKDLIDFLLKNWDEHSFYASIRKLYETSKKHEYKGQ